MGISKSGCSSSITKEDLENMYKQGFVEGYKHCQEILIAYDVEAVVENVYEIGRRFCNSVKCNKECQDCDHGVLIKAIIAEIRNGGIK